MPRIRKHFGKDDWNAGMVSSVCLTGEFPLIADRVWTRTRHSWSCAAGGWVYVLSPIHVCDKHS